MIIDLFDQGSVLLSLLGTHLGLEHPVLGLDLGDILLELCCGVGAIDISLQGKYAGTSYRRPGRPRKR